MESCFKVSTVVSTQMKLFGHFLRNCHLFYFFLEEGGSTLFPIAIDLFLAHLHISSYFLPVDPLLKLNVKYVSFILA